MAAEANPNPSQNPNFTAGAMQFGIANLAEVITNGPIMITINYDNTFVQLNAVREPSSLPLLGSGFVGMAGMLRRKTGR